MVININNQTDLLHEILQSCDCDATGIETSSRTEKIGITETEFTEKTSQNKQGISSEKKAYKKLPVQKLFNFHNTGGVCIRRSSRCVCLQITT